MVKLRKTMVYSKSPLEGLDPSDFDAKPPSEVLAATDSSNVFGVKLRSKPTALSSSIVDESDHLPLASSLNSSPDYSVPVVLRNFPLKETGSQEDPPVPEWIRKQRRRTADPSDLSHVKKTTESNEESSFNAKENIPNKTVVLQGVDEEKEEPLEPELPTIMPPSILLEEIQRPAASFADVLPPRKKLNPIDDTISPSFDAEYTKKKMLTDDSLDLQPKKAVIEKSSSSPLRKAESVESSTEF